MSPMQRSLKYLREQGYECAIVEHYNQYSRRKSDLFGFADILGVKEGSTIAVQTTTGDHVAERVRKIEENTVYPVCKLAGWLIHVHGWALRGPAGKRKLWTLRTVEL